MDLRQMTHRKQEQLMSTMRSKDIEARLKEKRKIIIQQYQPLLLREDLEDVLKGKILQLQDAYNSFSRENQSKLIELFNDIKSYISDHEMFDIVSLAVLKYEFLDFCLFILGPQFNHDCVKELQYNSIFVLVNFIAFMRKENPIFISTYIPFLNMRCVEIVTNLQRILQVNHRDDNMVQACYKLIGNILSEQSCCYNQVQQQIGILSLLQHPGHESLKVWILQIVLQNGEMLNEREIYAAFPILELMLNSPRRSDDYFNALFTITTLSHKMIGLKSQFQKIQFNLTFLRDTSDDIVLKNYQDLIIQLIIGLLRQQYIQDDRYLIQRSIELISVTLSSESQRNLDSGLWALERFAEYYDKELLEYDPYIPEKLIALGTSHNCYIVERAMYAICMFLEKQARQIFLKKDLFKLLSDNLMGLGEDITKISLKILLAVLQKSEEYDYDTSVSGSTEQKAYTQMLNQLQRTGIADQIYKLEYEQVKNVEVQELLNDVSQLIMYMMDCNKILMSAIPAYSIGTAKRGELAKKEGPGPNVYLPSVIPRIKQPEWTIGGQARRDQRISSIGPGPGAYNTMDVIEGPKFSIATKHDTLNKSNSLSPGPGNYNDESFVSSYKKMPSYTMGFKHNQSHKTDYIPGPGAYDPNISCLSGQMAKFTTQPRITYERTENSPGPGNYDIVKAAKIAFEKQPPIYSIGTQKRDGLAKKNHVPGPGQYELKTLIQGNKNFTFKGKIKDINKTVYMPGPGQYDMDMSMTKYQNPSYKIGTESRTLKSILSQKMPGPGQYYKEHMDSLSSLQKSAPSFKMPKALRKALNDSIDIPGPGQYSIPSPQGIKVTMKGAKYNGHRDNLPGPGTYNPDDSMVKQRQGSYKIVMSHKSQHFSQYLPGPGQYALKSTLEGPSFGFGREGRSQSHANTKSPGPGAYNIPPKFADVAKYLNCTSKIL